MSEAMDSAVDNGSKSEQLSDGRFGYTHLYKYRRDGTYLEGFTKAEKSGLRKRAKFFLRKGAIYTTLAANPVSACMHDSYQCTIHMKMKLVVEDVQKRKRILTNAHDSGHLGVNRMLDLVSKYYWQRLSEEVKEYVSMAHICMS